MSTEEHVRQALAALAEADASRRAPPGVERVVLDAFDRKRHRGRLPRAVATIWAHRYEALGMATAAVIALTIYVQSRSSQISPDALGIPDPVSAAVTVARVAPTMEIGDVVHAVHIQVPRTMLPMLGIPIIDPDAPGTVNVEFLLGNDGLARTIRIHP